MRGSILIILVALSTVACGPDCTALCEDAKECGDASEELDCEERCEDNEKTAEAAGCETQYEDVLSCLDGLDDVCDDDGCSSESKALQECMRK